MKASFDNTVNILVKAYLNDTLEHVNCTACAVGNLIADGMSTSPMLHEQVNVGEKYRYTNGIVPKWMEVFCSRHPGCQEKNPDMYTGEAKRQIDLTGYSWEDLARIELAFELDVDRYDLLNQPQEQKDRQMFNGLRAVIDVLAEIHNIDLTQKETAKALFVK